MSTVSKVRIKVPDADSLNRFVSEWDHMSKPSIAGEYDVPFTRDPISQCTVNPRLISHSIRDIDTSTFDPNTNTVVADVVFTGPYGRQAQDDFVKGDLRFCPRVVNKNNKKTKDPALEIITWDLVHRPGSDSSFDAALASAKEQIRQEENAKDKAAEIRKKMKR